jgi:hypothetical protein
VRVFFNEIAFATTASENNMGDTFQGTQAAQGHHSALAGNMPSLQPVIGTADITVHCHPISITQINL